MKYTPRTRIGLTWAGTTDVKEAYGWDPATLADGVPEKAVLGVEATLCLRDDRDPRRPGPARVPEASRRCRDRLVARRPKSWRDYRSRLAAQGPRLRALGVGYHADPSVPWR